MEALFVALRTLLVVGAMVVVAATTLSAVRTFVLPRAADTFLSRLVFVTVRRAFDRVVRRLDSYERQDAVMARRTARRAGTKVNEVLPPGSPVARFPAGWQHHRPASNKRRETCGYRHRQVVQHR